MDIENEECINSLKALVRSLREADPPVDPLPIIALQFGPEVEDFVQEKRGQIRVVMSIANDFVDHASSQSYVFNQVEAASIRYDVNRCQLRRVKENVNKEMEDLHSEIDYMHWQWIPSQLRLSAIPAIDYELEESADGSIGDLRFVRNLGKGSFGTVHEARSQSGETLAVKVMRKDRFPTILEVERVYREVQILAQIPRHPHLAQLHYVLHSVDTIYICLAYGGPQNLYYLQLRQPTQRFSNDAARDLFRQIAQAVGCLHSVHFYHRDIKPENIAVNGVEPRGYQLMLVDCGLAVKTEKPLRHLCGSLPFAAPEILDIPCQYYGGPADAFAIGMLLFEVVRGQCSMENILGWTKHTQPSPQRAQQLRTLLSNGPPNIHRERNEPRALTELFAGLLDVEASQRWVLPEVLRSSWLTNTDAEPMPILDPDAELRSPRPAGDMPEQDIPDIN
jgi:hypothetical protein